VQSSRMTPERREEIIMKVERSRAAESSRRKVKAVKSHAVRSKALVSEGLRQMECASAPSEMLAVHSRWTSAQSASKKRQETSLSKMAVMESSSAGDAMVMRAEEEMEEEDEGFAEAAALVGAAAPSALVRAVSGEAAEAAESEYEALLNQLKAEPTADDELMAKFGIYETYSEEVSQLRGTVFSLYEENKPSLPDAVKNDMERQIKGIDKAESMGIPDDARGWFVYHMMRQAGKNNTHMNGVMDNFEKKLEFLASNDQDECPVCLEQFSEACPADTLGCCHKVCHECWMHWASVMHGHPFCPLCKNEEFVEMLHQRISTG